MQVMQKWGLGCKESTLLVLAIAASRKSVNSAIFLIEPLVNVLRTPFTCLWTKEVPLVVVMLNTAKVLQTILHVLVARSIWIL